MQLAGSASDLFASSGAGNICALSYDGANTFTTICGDPITAVFGVVPMNPYQYQLGRYVWDGSTSLDLADLSTSTIDTALSFSFTGSPSRIRLADGTYLAVAQDLHAGPTWILHLVPPNHVESIPVSEPGNEVWYGDSMIGSDDFGFATGSVAPTGTKEAHLINLQTLVVDTANELSNLGLLQVGTIEFAGPDVLEIDGTGTNGLASTVYIDAFTGAKTTAPSEGSRYIQVQSVE